MKLSIIGAIYLSATDAFTAPMNYNKASIKTIGRTAHNVRVFSALKDHDQESAPTIEVHDAKETIAFNPLPAATAAFCLLSSKAANAAGPDWGKIFLRSTI